MPHLSGISLSKLIGPEPKVIFITAHAEYAPESYEVEAVDYLMKPVSFERFTKGIHKVLRKKSNVPADAKADEIINLRSDGNIHRVPAANIYFLEKAANYMAYHTIGTKILVRQSVAETLRELPADFIQAHKSFILNSNRVDYYNKEELTINGIKIPIGNTHRESFFQMFLEK